MLDVNPLVLVIDDDEMIRQAAKGVLEHAGYTVLLADNGRAGAEVFADHADEIALILLDLTMPVMGGAETLGKLLQIRPDARVVVMSGFDETETAKRFAGQSLSNFLQKPFSMEELVAKVREALGQT